MSQSIRSVVVTLAAGTGLQRAAALVNSVLLARGLGLDRLGELMFGLQIGVILGMLADSGVLAVAARHAAAEPSRVGGWVRAAIRARLVVAGALVSGLAACTVFFDSDPVFLLVCAATAIPGSFDLKGLSEAAGTTRSEVRIDCATALGYLGWTIALTSLGVTDLRWHAAGTLAARCVYAAFASRVAWSLPRCTPEPAALGLVRSAGLVSAAQATNGLAQTSDVILLRLLGTSADAGLFSVARRLAQAAEVPAAVLARAVQPHLDHAAAHGDARGTLRRAISIAGYASIPIAAGGWVIGGPLLVRLFGGEYAGAAWTLRWLLVSAVVVAVGSRFGTTLLAMHAARSFAFPLFAGATINLLLSVILIPPFGPAGSAVATLVAFSAIVGSSAVLLRRRMPLGVGPALARPLAAATAVAAGAWCVPASADPLLAVLAGAITFVPAVMLLERGSLRNLGAGLHGASGFGVSAPAADPGARSRAAAEGPGPEART